MGIEGASASVATRRSSWPAAAMTYATCARIARGARAAPVSAASQACLILSRSRGRRWRTPMLPKAFEARGPGRRARSAGRTAGDLVAALLAETAPPAFALRSRRAAGRAATGDDRAAAQNPRKVRPRLAALRHVTGRRQFDPADSAAHPNAGWLLEPRSPSSTPRTSRSRVSWPRWSRPAAPASTSSAASRHCPSPSCWSRSAIRDGSLKGGFARYNGTAPLAASTAEGPSGPVRHRYNPSSDRRVNAILYRMAVTQLAASRAPRSSTPRRAPTTTPRRNPAGSSSAISRCRLRRMTRDQAVPRALIAA